MSAAEEHERYKMVVAAAQKKLDQAVETFFNECEYSGVMTAWVLVAHHAGMVEGRDSSSYGVATMNDSQPFHVIEGLLRQGIRDTESSMYEGGDYDEE